MRQSNAKNAQSAQRNAELGSKVESIVEQVASLKSVVDGLESSLGITRVELEGAVSRMKRGEADTRKVEEALQKLQNNLLKDLSDGITEVKESREKDFSSLERIVEERLADVSQSITASMAEFTEAQGEARSQLDDLKARLGDMEDPALIKQELAAIAETVADIKTAGDAGDSLAAALTAQISAVRDELQTRNGEVASLSEEVESVRSVLQTTTGALRNSLSAAETEIQTLRAKTETLESGVEEAAVAARAAERQVEEVGSQAQRRSEELEARLKSSEESADSLSADLSSRAQSLLAKFNAHESILATQGELVEKLQADLERQVEAARGQDASEVEDLKRRLAALEENGGGGGGARAEQLESLRSAVAGLQGRAEKLESHDRAIASLQDALQKTTQTLASLSKKKK
ncbi:cytoskeleton-associated protein 4 isoform X2 [Salarias fasciatus]|nr:cytoskeleton-associated protein 4 isoform X2 [Salarias fasciatus]